MEKLKDIVSKFDISGKVSDVKPIGEGLINDTYKVLCSALTTPFSKMSIC